MAHLFSKIVLKDALKNISIPDIEGKIALLQEWNAMYQKGELQKKKETAFEATYSEKLFGMILGYSDVSDGVYTREKHPKNSSNGQTCDIGLGYYSSEKNETQAVVELKDAGTSIDRPQQREGNMTPIQQGFKYKPLYNSRWVIVSNYYEFRLYRDTYQDYEVWTLADLVNPANDYEKFCTFYLLLRAESLISETGESETEKLLAKVRIEQETITKKFYKEYSGLREELMRDIWKNNPTLRNESVVTITQRIIDRIVFVHFCEDRGLLPQNKLAENLTRAKEIDLTPWEVLMLYFRGIDKGSEKLGIPDGYNGGLFRDNGDAIKNLKVSDDVITKFIELGRYDFSDEGGQLSVEILGHIFEQSISDLESIREKIKNPGGESEEKKVSKRKKDGIFYTPAYIVDYIVRNSLGKYLEEHEERIKEQYKLKGDITEKNYRKREIEAYTEYQKILHTVKVLDPACGSGAFLVRVFDFLLEENKRVANILTEGAQSDLFQSEMYFREILKNNIYGVDLNEESVEITKLSLWLKSAVRGKKLETLDNNIKCGNSLIDDPAVAGDKAFNWNTEFANIMASGGFDVIVGNPPYVSSYGRQAQSFPPNELTFLLNNLRTFNVVKNRKNISFNTIMGFIEKGILLVKQNGYTGFIIDQAYLQVDVYDYSRTFLLSNSTIRELSLNVNFPGVIAETAILILNKSKNDNYNVTVRMKELDAESYNFQLQDLIQNNKITFSLNSNILRKIENNSVTLSALANIATGMQIIPEYFLSDDDSVIGKPKWHRAAFSKNISRYKISWPLEGQPGKYITYDNELQDKIRLELTERIKKGENCRTPASLSIGSADKESRFDSPKIIIAQTISNAGGKVRLQGAFDDYGYYGNVSIHLVGHSNPTHLKALLCIINSSLMTFYAKESKFIMGAEKGSKKTPQIRKGDIEKLPIASNYLASLDFFVNRHDKIIFLNRELNEKSEAFMKNISAKYAVEKVTRKLEKWWELDFAEFLKETKIKVSLAEQEELLTYFETRKKEITEIDTQIRKTDAEIDEMVFDLYGLTEEERSTVLNS